MSFPHLFFDPHVLQGHSSLLVSTDPTTYQALNGASCPGWQHWRDAELETLGTGHSI